MGVDPRGPVSLVGGYSRWGDIHGWSSRWVSPVVGRMGELRVRDRRIKGRVEEWRGGRGWVRNQCRVTRCASYVRVYVDGYRLEEPRLREGDSGELGEQVVAGEGVPSEVEGTRLWEEVLSESVERGKPVQVRLVCLNELLDERPTDSWESRSDAVSGGKRGWYRWDRRQLTALLARVPSVRRWVTAVARRRSSQLPRVATTRRVVELLTYQGRSSEGLWRLGGGASERDWDLAGSKWDPAKVAGRLWRADATDRSGRQLRDSRESSDLVRDTLGWLGDSGPQEGPALLDAGDLTEGIREGEGQTGRPGELRLETPLQQSSAEWWAGGRDQRGHWRSDVRQREEEDQPPHHWAGQPKGDWSAEESDRPLLGFKGYRREFKGRVGGAERARVVATQVGSLPRNTWSAPRDYAVAEAHTPSGVRAIRRRICYG